MDRRAALRLFACGGGAAVLAACAAPPSGPSTTGQASTTAPVSTATNTPPGTTASASSPTVSVTNVPTSAPGGVAVRRGGTLRVGQVGDISSLDPAVSQFVTTENTGLAYDRLIALDLHAQPMAMLAESWDLSPDYRQIKFMLRSGVQFHTGRELTSDDVKYSFTVGTGPYRFVEWAQGDHIAFERNPNYWQSSVPYLDTVRTSFFTDSQAMVTQFEGGALDLIRTPPTRDYVRLKADSHYQGISHPIVSNAYGLGANVHTPPTDNKLFRQALNWAIDRQRFVDTLLLGVGTAQDLPWSDFSPMYDASKLNVYGYDLDKAKSLLAQAGDVSRSLDFSPFPATPEGTQFAELYQGDLAKLGITLNMNKQDTPSWTAAINGLKYTGMYSEPSVNLHLTPGTLFNISAPLRPTNNNVGYSDDRYTQLIASVGSETDPVKQKQIYAQINDVLLDESFAMYLSPTPIIMLGTAGLHDVTPNAHGGWLLTTTWLDNGR